MNKHIEEMTKIIWDNPNMYDLPSAEDVAFELYNAGYRKIPTNDWLIKGVSEEQLAKEKAEVVVGTLAKLKCNVAREIFEEIDKAIYHLETPIGKYLVINRNRLSELKKKYESEGADDANG